METLTFAHTCQLGRHGSSFNLPDELRKAIEARKGQPVEGADAGCSDPVRVSRAGVEEGRQAGGKAAGGRSGQAGRQAGGSGVWPPWGAMHVLNVEAGRPCRMVAVLPATAVHMLSPSGGSCGPLLDLKVVDV